MQIESRYFRGAALAALAAVMLSASGFTAWRGVAKRPHPTPPSTKASAFACSTSLSQLTPCASSASTTVGFTGQRKTYTIRNLDPSDPVNYSITCSVAGAVTACKLVNPTSGALVTTLSLTVNRNSSKTFDVDYSAGASPGSGSVTVNANDGFTPVSATLSVTVNPRPTSPPLHLISVSPSYRLHELDPGASAGATFTLTEQGADTATYQYSVACSGSAISGSCSPTSGSVLLTPNVPSPVMIGFATGSSVGAAGSVRLTAWRAAGSTVRDSGEVAIALVQGTPVVDVASANPGGLVERDLCLTVAVSDGAAYECAGLRLAVALPGVRTRNKDRAPVLLYQSQTAHPTPVVGADVTLPNDGLIPVTVSARLLDSTGTALASGSWSGSDWAAASTRRIALSFDASAFPTGVHRYSFEVTRSYSSSTAKDTATNELIIVNRGGSPYGPGWWVSGLEQVIGLADGSLLWVGGDGSARHYRATGISNKWAASPLDRPDTMTFDGTRYRRTIPHGTSVFFDGSGRHTLTVNRLQDTTSFTYDGSGRLTTITVPRSSFGVSFGFSYASGAYGTRLSTVTAPSVDGQSRVTTLSYDGSGQHLSLSVPGNAAIDFAYSLSTAYRIDGRTDERGTTATFSYSNGLFTGASTPLGGGPAIATAIVPQESRGLTGGTATPREGTYSRIDGPRTDVSDTALVWSDGLGSVRRIRDAAGNETVLSRDDARWPGLVTKSRSPAGRLTGAAYDGTGHLTAMTDSSRYDPVRAKYATTTFDWDAVWDFVTLVHRPEGDIDRFSYDGSNGNRLWQEDGRGSTSRVTFDYYTSGVSVGLPRAVIHAGTAARDSVEYDGTLSNLSRTISAIGNPVEYLTDAIGRDTLVRYPIDAAGTMYRVRTRRDLAGRDTLVVTASGTDSLSVRQHFDGAGNLDTLRRRAIPDINSIGDVTQAFGYDAGNRKTSEALVGRNTITWTLDAAGNVLSGGRKPRTNTYDALNRVVTSMGSDTSRFTYDAEGRVRTANNSAARVSRTYAPSGDLVADTLRIGTAFSEDLNFESHIYGIGYGADLDGRRSWVRHPGALRPGVGQDSVAFAYDSTHGQLASVRDVFGHTYQFAYDAEGQLSGRTLLADQSTPITETLRYYDDGTLRARIQQVNGTTLHSDSLRYDRRGKIVRNVGNGDTVAYSPLGQLVHALYSSAAGPEDFVFDALGNMYSSTMFGAQYPAGSQYQYVAGTDRLLTSARSTVSGVADTNFYGHNSVGDLTTDSHVHSWPDGLVQRSERRITVNTWGADQRLLASSFTLDSVNAINANYHPYEHVERYRYDALGRRVWKRIYRGTNCSNHDQTSGCRNETTRIVWDGDQVLYEVRATADSTSANEESDSGTGFNGRIGYIHAGGTDAPLSIFKGSSLMLPFTNWRGQYDKGTCPTSVCSGSLFAFPGDQASSFGDTPKFVNGPPSWWGDLIVNQQDASGYQYKRNRYYDPQAGRFTQEDPIGLAGGMNLYGFAGGDPINFSDPMGLCPSGAGAGFDGLACVLSDAIGGSKTAVASAASAIATHFVESVNNTAACVRDPVCAALSFSGSLGEVGAAGRPGIGAIKEALEEVHLKVGKLPKGEPGKFGSPQRGTSVKGYRLDPGHSRDPGSPEAGWHINWWDYSQFKRSSGKEVSGAVPIRK